jgi:hypothetical protein
VTKRFFDSRNRFQLSVFASVTAGGTAGCNIYFYAASPVQRDPGLMEDIRAILAPAFLIAVSRSPGIERACEC